MVAADSALNVSLVTLIVGLLGLWGVREKSNSKQIETYQKRLADTQSRLDSEEKDRIKAEIRAIEMSFEIKRKVTESDIIERYIDSLPFPAWIKRQERDGDIVMVMINRAYEIKYDIKKARYEGKTDAQVWPRDLAKNFEKNDRLVLESKGYHRSNEKVIEDGKTKTVEVWKFSLEFQDGSFGIGGLIVED